MNQTRAHPDADLPWLLHQRVALPHRADSYYARAGLVERCDPTSRRLTVLQAPGGFGKTTLLAQACRSLRDRGVPTAWLSLDEQDQPSVLETYLRYAFHSAGLDILDPLPSTHGTPRTSLLLHAIEAHGAPCVLALDELERLTNPASVDVINFLLHRGPANLHLAMATRALPPGLNIAPTMLDGRATVLTVDELRFSKSEIGCFFNPPLSHRELASLATDSDGWPIALRIYRNQRKGRTSAASRLVGAAFENWVESRLWYGLSDEDRDFILDIGLFEWIDSDLLDEVLERDDSRYRIDALPVLAGLSVLALNDGADAWRLHPLVRDHCIKQRLLKTPERYRSVHRRMATALARRGETSSAMTHADKSGDTVLVAAILEDVGGLRLLMQEGMVALKAAERLLHEDMLRDFPRLQLMRCVVLVMSGRLAEARQLYDAVAANTGGFAKDPRENNLELRSDGHIVEELLLLSGCDPLGSDRFQAMVANGKRLAERADVNRLVRASIDHGLCLVANMKAEFDEALDRAERAQTNAGDDSPYLSMYLDFQLGMVAMAQGQVETAIRWYTQGRKAAKVVFLGDPLPAAIGVVLIREIQLERNRLGHAGEVMRIPKILEEGGTSYFAHVAAAGVVAELALQKTGVDGALASIRTMLRFARRNALPMLVRHLAALRVSTLATAGRVDEAERTWQTDKLPEDLEGCLDLRGQSWREMEALSSARLRLLVALEEFDAARDFAHAFARVAMERGLRRTWMRILAMSMTLEYRAGDSDAARAHLVEFLRLFAQTDYIMPLVREREISLAVLNSVPEADTDPALATAGRALLPALTDAMEGKSSVPTLTIREADILWRIETQRDKKIASDLGLSLDGVRYHVRKLFLKLGARSRLDAVHRARAMGIGLSDL